MTSLTETMLQIGKQAKAAAVILARTKTQQKNQALAEIANQLTAQRETLKQANALDLASGKANGLDSAMLDRLTLSDKVIDSMIEGVRQIIALIDPIGEINELRYRPEGFQVGKMRVPLGVIGIIYESRPNVTVDAAALCLKSGNACILRGGSEAIHSNQAIAKCIQAGLTVAGLPDSAVQIIQTTDREAVGELIRMDRYVDVVIPRGGKSLIERISREARVPVIKHLDGICHVYIDDKADLEKAFKVAINAKTQRYGTCNTMETLLVAESVAAQILPELAKNYQTIGVELRGCDKTVQILTAAQIPVQLATAEDWDTEYLAPILSIKVVSGIEQAIEHIRIHSSSHTDSIITEDWSHAQRFLTEVDSSSVMVNASTRLADGFVYGLGAEIGISTDKFHARGPVGLEGLTSQKFIVLGDGHIRQ